MNNLSRTKSMVLAIVLGVTASLNASAQTVGSNGAASSAKIPAEQRAQMLFNQSAELVEKICGQDAACRRAQWQSALDFVNKTANRQTQDPAYRDQIVGRLRSMMQAQMK